jgi:cytidylate kinase
MSSDIIAIDGPSASGKSTVARRVAARLGRLYVDSGALYRGITWRVLEEGRDPAQAEQVLDSLRSMPIEFFVAEGAVRFLIGGYEPVAEIRSERVNERVSLVAAVCEVRAQATTWLRTMAAQGPLVMEGRDIGTVVFPDARFKFYLDASPAERARRRHAEQEGTDVGRVMASLQTRDRRDSGRQTAPLRVAGDACTVDTTGLSIDEVVDRIVAIVSA